MHSITFTRPGRLCWILGLLVLSISGCASEEAPAPASDPLEALRAHMSELMTRPEHDAAEVEVQHLLVAFKGAAQSKATRSKQEAEQLAAELYARALAGEYFDDLVRESTDDAHPGIYTMTAGQPAGGRQGVYSRSVMANAFGDVGWRLEVGAFGVSDYDPQTGPFGYHIIKRLR